MARKDAGFFIYLFISEFLFKLLLKLSTGLQSQYVGLTWEVHLLLTSFALIASSVKCE